MPSLPANIPSLTRAQRSQAELRQWLPSLLLHLVYLELVVVSAAASGWVASPTRLLAEQTRPPVAKVL